MSEPEIMTIEEVAKYLRVSERTVYDWAQKSEIPCGKLGTSWRFKRTDVESWVNRQLSQESIKPGIDDLKLHSLLDISRVLVLEKGDKKTVFNLMIDKMGESSLIKSVSELRNGIFDREELMSTGIGLNLGIPHVRLKSVKDVILALALVKDGIKDYEALDSMPVKLVFMIVAREDQHVQHLKLLSKLSSALKNDAFRNQLLSCETPEALFSKIKGE